MLIIIITLFSHYDNSEDDALKEYLEHNQNIFRNMFNSFF